MSDWRWLERVVFELPFFRLFFPTHLDQDTDNHGDNDEKDDGDEDSFEKKLHKTHLEKRLSGSGRERERE